MFLTSLVLLAVTALISHRSYLNLSEQFVQQRNAGYQRYTREMQSFLQQTRERLISLATVIPYLPGIHGNFGEGNGEAIREAFDPQWPVLQMDWDLQRVAFFDTAGEIIAEWRVDDWASPSTPNISSAWINATLQQERALSGIHCASQCQVFATVPVLIDARKVGAVLLIGPLTEALGLLRELSGHDVALLISGQSLPDPSSKLPGWNVSIAALTRAELTRPVLERATQFSLGVSTLGVEVSLGEQVFDIVTLPLPETSGQLAYFAIIANISKQLTAIQDATREVLLTAVAGWVLSQCLLLAILWSPLSRLRHTADSLPLLARGEFRAFRLSQQRRQPHLRIPDEIDHLNQTAVSLAHRLEQLEDEVEKHTYSLSTRMEELARERDFVTSLLHTAQVMIVTQDGNGRILMINPFVCTLTGYATSDLVGQDFTELLTSQRQRELHLLLGREMSQTHRDHIQHESLVSCKDGAIRNIVWYHSRLSQRHDNDPVVLSVGLDITERRGAESRLAWLADHDVLTGLLNRRRFQEEMEVALRDTLRQQQVGALLVIDIDQFKFINDTGGHQAGDQALKGVARILSNEPRGKTLCARLGGDEFALLLRNTSTTEVQQFARKLHGKLLALTIPHGIDQTLRLSVSTGIVLFPTDAAEVGELIACANLAVYQAKEEQPGGWHLFSTASRTRERLRDRIYWKERVANALNTDGFELFFQPILNLHNRRVEHYEVLIRMRDGEQLIPPVQFIDAAERGGMIHALDRHVVSKALNLLARLRRLGRDINLSINLSGHAFSDPDLLHHIQRELQHNDIPPQRIIFEITETAAVADFAVAYNLMLAVKELGCAFALDDFGIGFSSFYYLKHLPVDYLKIDGSFIRQLPDSLDDQIIVEAIAAVARGFGKKLIAEYVETESTLPLLERYGVDFAQGFLIGRPQPALSVFPELGGPVAVESHN